MEQQPKIRTIGKASTEKQEQAKKEILQALFNHFESLSPEERRELGTLEYPKSKQEIAAINFANKITGKLMKKAGVEPYDIPLENYHIIPPKLYAKADKGGTAVTYLTRQGILFNAEHYRGNPVYFGSSAIHETLHLKAHFTLEVEEEVKEEVEESGGKLLKTPYREGISIRALQRYSYHGRYHEHFSGLHEGIVAEAEKRLLPRLLDLPEFAEEKKWLMSDKAKELKNKIAQEKKILEDGILWGVSEDDIIWVSEDGNEWEVFSYPIQREVVNYICREIQQKFPEQYKNADEVFEEFLKAHFTGRLLPIARLIEKTFGKGSFRMLGNMGESRESGVSHLEALKKAIARV